VIAGAGAAAVAIGCFLPWIKVTAAFIGSITKSGMEGGDGIFFLGMAAAVALIAGNLWRGPLGHPKGTRAWMVVLVLGLMGLMAMEVIDISSKFAEARESELIVSTSYGAGLWLIGLGIAAIGYAWLRTPWGSMHGSALRDSDERLRG
jgi:hypothetical protein